MHRGLTLLSMAKIWIEAFWKPHPAPSITPGAPLPAGAWASCGALSLLALAMGLMPGPLIDFLMAAAGTMAPPVARPAP